MINSATPWSHAQGHLVLVPQTPLAGHHGAGWCHCFCGWGLEKGWVSSWNKHRRGSWQHVGLKRKGHPRRCLCELQGADANCQIPLKKAGETYSIVFPYFLGYFLLLPTYAHHIAILHSHHQHDVPPLPCLLRIASGAAWPDRSGGHVFDSPPRPQGEASTQQWKPHLWVPQCIVQVTILCGNFRGFNFFHMCPHNDYWSSQVMSSRLRLGCSETLHIFSLERLEEVIDPGKTRCWNLWGLLTSPFRSMFHHVGQHLLLATLQLWIPFYFGEIWYIYIYDIYIYTNCI